MVDSKELTDPEMDSIEDVDAETEESPEEELPATEARRLAVAGESVAS